MRRYLKFGELTVTLFPQMSPSRRPRLRPRSRWRLRSPLGSVLVSAASRCVVRRSRLWCRCPSYHGCRLSFSTALLWPATAPPRSSCCSPSSCRCRCRPGMPSSSRTRWRSRWCRAWCSDSRSSRVRSVWWISCSAGTTASEASPGQSVCQFVRQLLSYFEMDGQAVCSDQWCCTLANRRDVVPPRCGSTEERENSQWSGCSWTAPEWLWQSIVGSPM